MRSKKRQSAEAAVNDIRRRTRRKFSSEEKIRIGLEGLPGAHITRPGTPSCSLHH